MVSLAAEQFGWGLAAALAALVALLVTGTQVLAWYWPLALLLVTFGIGWWRSRRRMPDEYVSAQKLDNALGLGDLLSTIWHYSRGTPARHPDPKFLDSLEAAGAEAAPGIDPGLALPFRPARSAWVALGLLVVAGGVFTLRYGILRTFDLRPPLAHISFDTLTGAPAPVKDQLAQTRKAGDLPSPVALDVEGERTGVDQADKIFEDSLRTYDVVDPNQIGRKGTGEQGRQVSEMGNEASDDNESAEEGDKTQAGEGAPSAADQKKGGEQNNKLAQEKNSLLDKLKDAFNNMMDKLKMDQKGSESASAKASSKQGDGKKSDKGSPSSRRNEQGDPSDRPGEQQPGENAQVSQNMRDQAAMEAPEKGERSGVGKEDGSKDTELAEQAEALGKLSELLGQRAKSVQGEVMVEVTNSKNQQLKTPFVQKQAAHAEAGSEVGRDQVPLHLQDYVQRYYERVRKEPPAPQKQ